MTSPAASVKSSFDEGDRVEALAPDLHGSTEKQQPLIATPIPQPAHAHSRSGQSAIKKLYSLIRIVFLMATVGFYLYTHPDNYLIKPLQKGITSIQEWRHHPYTLPEFYTLCSRHARGIYTSEAGNEWVQCVTVQNGTIVDVGDLGK